VGQILENPRRSQHNIGSAPAAATTLRRKGYAWQATKKRINQRYIDFRRI